MGTLSLDNSNNCYAPNFMYPAVFMATQDLRIFTKKITCHLYTCHKLSFIQHFQPPIARTAHLGNRKRPQSSKATTRTCSATSKCDRRKPIWYPCPGCNLFRQIISFDDLIVTRRKELCWTVHVQLLTRINAQKKRPLAISQYRQRAQLC